MDQPLKAPESIHDVLGLIAPARQDFAAQWQGLSAEEMTRRPGPQEDWSVKDQIAHISWWEGYMMDRLALLAAGEEITDIQDVDAVNARVFAQHADLPLDLVLEGFERNWSTMQALLKSITIEQLLANQGLALRILSDNTFGHYAEHQPDLVNYANNLRAH